VNGQTRTAVPDSAQHHPGQLAVVVIRELWDEGFLIRQPITGKYRALERRMHLSLTVSHFEILHFCCMLQEIIAFVISVTVFLYRHIHKIMKSKC
jgi:hypothetical protein